MNLYAGKILQVDLSTQTLTSVALQEKWLKDYWGCWGLALRYFWDLVTPDVEPLSPENAVVIMTGPLCGTLVPTTSRFCLVSKSPQTGTIFETNTGGAFGPELKFAGFDGITITGRCKAPVYLKIIDGSVSLEDARPLTGKGIFETEDLLKHAAGSAEAKTLAIGPAGENQVKYACLGTEYYRQMGRGGPGALFGSKNLKGIVCRGSGAVAVNDMGAFLDRVVRYKEKDLFTEDNLWAKTDGTAILIDAMNEMGLHPTRNFTFGVNEEKDAINSDAIKAAKTGDRACCSCPLGCGKYVHIEGDEVEGPEYETLCLAGSNCEINDLRSLIRFNRLCDDLGLDTISCGNTIGLAMELGETGRHDFGLKFGKSEDYLQVVSEIANLSSLRGRNLAMGAKSLAQKYNCVELALEGKGMEYPAYDPRGDYGMGVAYATAERGACHLRAFTVFNEDTFDIAAQTHAVVASQNWNAVKWSMCVCDFWGTINSEIMADLLSAGLGDKVQPAELEVAGERIWNLTRIFNLRAGFTAKDDTLPPRIMHQPLQKGPHAGRVFSQSDFKKAMKLYNELRGWNANGTPEKNTLVRLGLDQM